MKLDQVFLQDRIYQIIGYRLFLTKSGVFGVFINLQFQRPINHHHQTTLSCASTFAILMTSEHYHNGTKMVN